MCTNPVYKLVYRGGKRGLERVYKKEPLSENGALCHDDAVKSRPAGPLTPPTLPATTFFNVPPHNHVRHPTTPSNPLGRIPETSTRYYSTLTLYQIDLEKPRE